MICGDDYPKALRRNALDDIIIDGSFCSGWSSLHLHYTKQVKAFIPSTPHFLFSFPSMEGLICTQNRNQSLMSIFLIKLFGKR